MRSTARGFWVNQRAGVTLTALAMLGMFLASPLVVILGGQSAAAPVIEVTFDRQLSGDRVGQHKAPPFAPVAMTITATVSSPIGNGVLIDYFPNEWSLIDAKGGAVSVHGENYNKIEWNVGAVSNSVSKSYVVRSPQLTSPPTKYYFHSELTYGGGSAIGDDWMVVVADPPDTVTLRPNDNGYSIQWSISDSTHYGATSDQSDTTYVYSSTVGQTEFLNLDDPTFSDINIINWIQVYYRCRSVGGSAGPEKIDLYIRSNGTDTQTDANRAVNRTAFTDIAGTPQITNPVTGNPWTKSEVAALQAGMIVDTVGAGEEIQCSEIWVVVDYNPWNLIETWTGTVEAPAEWQLIETWIGTIQAPAEWQLAEIWTGNVQAPVVWQIVETWVGTIEAAAQWNLMETWSGAVNASAQWNKMEEWSGTVGTLGVWQPVEIWTSTIQAPVEWEIVEIWTGTVGASAGWNLVETWTGVAEAPTEWKLTETWSATIESPVEWQLIEEWMGTISTPAMWNLVETWTGATSAPVQWQLIETWTGTIETPVVGEWQLIETWTGIIEVPAEWQLMETWAGTIQAPAGWRLIEAWTGVIEAPTEWKLIETWSGAIEAPTKWQLIEEWMGTISAPSVWDLIESWTGAVYAPVTWQLIETWTGAIEAEVAQWNLIETWTGAIQAPAAWQIIETRIGTVQAPIEWQLVETWTGSIGASAGWNLVETWTGVIEASVEWRLLETWTGVAEAPTEWKLIETWSGAIETPIEWRLVETWTGTASAPAQWQLIESWMGTIKTPVAAEWQLIETWTGIVQVPAEWQLIETWTGVAEAPAEWQMIETWTGRVETPAEWQLTETWTGTVEAPASWQLIETWTGTVQVPAEWQLIETWTGVAEAPAEWQMIETWTGKVEAPAEWQLTETWTGTVEAPASWQLVESWTGTVTAPVAWQLIEAWTGTVSPPAGWQLIETWMGTVQAPAGWRLMETWTGTVQAPAVWQSIESWTGTLTAPVAWQVIETWTGTVGAPVRWQLIETWTGTVQAPAQWQVIETRIGTVQAPAQWQLIETWTGTVETPAEWQMIETWTGTVNAPVEWQLIEAWTGTIEAAAEWQLTETWTGTVDAALIRAVDISISPSWQEGSPGQTLLYIVTVNNTGNLNDKYNLIASDNLGWTLEISPTELWIEAGDNDNAFLSVTIPLETANSITDLITVRAEGTLAFGIPADPENVSAEDTAEARCTVIRTVNVSISPSYQDGLPGALLTYTVTITNTGNALDTYELTTSDNAGWSPIVLPSSIGLSPSASGNATLKIIVPLDATNCTRDNIIVTATSQIDNAVSSSASCIAHVVTITIRGPIHIVSNDNFTEANGVISGLGTLEDPYIIGYWDINAENVHGIWIESTDVYFIIRSVRTHDGGYGYNYGIYFDHVENGKIESATSYFNDIGIYLKNSSNNIISQSNASYNANGIYFQSSSNNIIEKCTASNNFSHGIHLESSDNNIISNCTAKNNTNGIYLQSSSNNKIIDNSNTSNNGLSGIVIRFSSENNLVKESVAENNYYGIYISDLSDNNCIYHNSFRNYPYQAWDNCSNRWDNSYPSGGNYWSDYAGVDNYRGENQDIPGSDGIGDTPYVIPAGTSKDRYPLVIRSIKLSISLYYQEGMPGAKLSYTVTLTNMGTIVDNYSLTVSDNAGWGPTITPSSLSVYPDNSENAILEVTIPENAENCNRDNIRVIARSQTDNTVSVESSCTAHAIIRGVMVSISPSYQSASPGVELAYTVTVTNTGLADDNYNLSATDNSGWGPSVTPSSLSVSAGENGTATLNVTIPENAIPSEEDNITVVAISQANPNVSDNDSCMARASIGRGVEVLISPRENGELARENVTFTVKITNTGNAVDNYDLAATDNLGWGPTLSENSLENVQIGENRSVTLNVTIPENAEPYTGDNVTVIATSRGDPGVSDNDSCIAYVLSPKAEFSLVTIYKVALDLDLWLDNGSKLVVKFYTWAGAYQGENVVWSGTTPARVVLLENIPHPETNAVENATLVLTTDNTENVIETVATFTVTRSTLNGRLVEIYLEWPFASPERRSVLMSEIVDIYLQWPFAPP